MGNEDSPSVLAAFSFQNVTTAVTTTCRMFIFATGIAVIISDVGWRGFHFLGTIDMDVQHPDEVAGNKMSSKDNGMET